MCIIGFNGINITISGGNITVTGGEAGIDGTNVTITGGEIKITGGSTEVDGQHIIAGMHSEAYNITGGTTNGKSVILTIQHPKLQHLKK